MSSKREVILIEGEELNIGNSLKYISIPHPKDHIPITCLLHDNYIYELQSAQFSKYGSWFLNQRISSNSEFYMATKLDSTYLAIPLLRKCADAYRPIDQIIHPSEEHGRHLLQCVNRKLLSRICDVKELDEDNLILYRYNEIKLLNWLKQKVDKTTAVMIKQNSYNDDNNSSKYAQGFDISAQSVAGSAGLNRGGINAAAEVMTVRMDDTVKAFQLIADYLEEAVSKLLLAFLNIDPSHLLSKSASAKRLSDWEKDVEFEKQTSAYLHQSVSAGSAAVTAGSSMTSPSPRNANNNPSSSSASTQQSNKKLKLVIEKKEEKAKAASKGMKSINSFFKKT